ncbi:MAG TPA: SPOR domain-containing protein [Daejeonella sp.]|nr:SPOR domain-containing protein [Daejeonella sp.]
MKKLVMLLTLTGMLVCSKALAQKPGKVEVIKDPKIDSLIARRVELSRSGAISVNGFRVQIFSGTSRQEAYDQQARFQTLYPGVRTYISYEQPNYKVRVGDFRTRLEAEKLMNKLRRFYPALFIFSEHINLK